MEVSFYGGVGGAFAPVTLPLLAQDGHVLRNRLRFADDPKVDLAAFFLNEIPIPAGSPSKMTGFDNVLTSQLARLHLGPEIASHFEGRAPPDFGTEPTTHHRTNLGDTYRCDLLDHFTCANYQASPLSRQFIAQALDTAIEHRLAVAHFISERGKIAQILCDIGTFSWLASREGLKGEYYGA